VRLHGSQEVIFYNNLTYKNLEVKEYAKSKNIKLQASDAILLCMISREKLDLVLNLEAHGTGDVIFMEEYSVIWKDSNVIELT
jgi:hypothetical protein